MTERDAMPAGERRREDFAFDARLSDVETNVSALRANFDGLRAEVRNIAVAVDKLAERATRGTPWGVLVSAAIGIVTVMTIVGGAWVSVLRNEMELRGEVVEAKLDAQKLETILRVERLAERLSGVDHRLEVSETRVFEHQIDGHPQSVKDLLGAEADALDGRIGVLEDYVQERLKLGINTRTEP